MDFDALRGQMVEEQLIARGIKDKRVIEAFRKVERHKFVPEEHRPSAYSDFPIPILEGQTISQPYIVALMSQSLKLTGNERVLEIGTGSGYQAAIIAELAKEVFSVERREALAKKAEEVLNELKYDNVKIKVGDGTLGWSEFAPFDAVLVTAASPRVPSPLIEQLKEEGKMIIPLGETLSQVLTLVEKKDGRPKTTPLCGCIFVPLIGKWGYSLNS